MVSRGVGILSSKFTCYVTTDPEINGACHRGHKLFSKYLLFRDAYATAGVIFSGVSACASLKGFINFLERGALGGFLEIFVAVFVSPIRDLLMLFGYSPTATQVALLFFYTVFGATTIRTFYSIYDPSSEMVVKGVWGRVSRKMLFDRHVATTPILKWAYTIIMVVLWPLVVLEYSLFWRNVWRRYMDHAGPFLENPIGTFTSNARTVHQLMPGARWCNYNPICDHDLDSDTWYRKEGNFLISFGQNLAALILVVVLLAVLSYVTRS